MDAASELTQISDITQNSGRRQVLMDAALEIFTEKGFHNASMDDVALRAGVSKPIVYQSFASKHDLYMGILDDSVTNLVRDITEVISQQTDNRKRVEAAIAFYFDRVEAADIGYRLIFESDFTSNPDVRARVDELISQLARIIGQDIARETGLTTAEANILAGALSGMAQAGAWRWINLGRPVSKEKAVRGISYLAWTGLSSFRTT
jgi:AcrR family transcriptional regulator